MKLRGLLGMFAMVLVVTGTAQGAGLLTVDSFDTSQLDSVGGGGGPSATSASGAGILGGTRDMTLLSTGGLPFFSLTAEANGGGAGLFSYSADPTVTGSVLLEYDGGMAGFDPTGLGGIDVTNGGLVDQIGIRVAFDDLPVDLKLTAYSNGTDFSEFTLSLPGGIFSDTDFFINFASFTVAGGAGADFTNLGALTLFIDGQLQGTDLIFDFLQSGQSIPEPVSLAGWMVCLMTAGVFAYRRKGLSRG